jgi:hypothetical protein
MQNVNDKFGGRVRFWFIFLITFKVDFVMCGGVNILSEYRHMSSICAIMSIALLGADFSRK